MTAIISTIPPESRSIRESPSAAAASEASSSIDLQTHYWSRSPLAPDVGAGLSNGPRNLVWEYQHDHLEGFVFGDCRDELQYQTTVFGSRMGLHYILFQNGKGASGCLVLAHGTDGTRISAAFDGLGPDGIDITNSQLVTMAPTAPVQSPDRTFIYCGDNLNSTVRLHNSTIFGYPSPDSATVKGGTLVLDLASVWGYCPFVVTGSRKARPR